jgi:hypothetical protein
MSTNPNYSYLRFVTMPYSYTSSPVSPHRPNNTSKRMHKVEFVSTLFTMTAGSELEIIFLDGYVNGTTSEALALFIQYNAAPTDDIQSRQSGLKRTLIGKPTPTDISTAYVGGLIRLLGGATSTLQVEYRYYEPYSYNAPLTYSSIPNSSTSTSSIRYADNYGQNNTIAINCLPVDLRFKRFSNLTYADFHRMACHIKVKNIGATTGTVDVYGCWFLETVDYSTSGGISYSQDTKCPMKLAEYVIGQLRNSSAVYTDSVTTATKLANLDQTITSTIAELTKSWDILAESREVEQEEEDWSIQPRVSNN